MFAVVFFSGCICSANPRVHTVTFYGNESIESMNSNEVDGVAVGFSLEATTTIKKLSDGVREYVESTSSTTTTILEDVTTTTQESNDELSASGHISSSTKSVDVEFVSGRFCRDLDSGINTDMKGVVEDNGGRYEDFCDGDAVYEHYCDNGLAQTIKITCLRGCRDGKCLENSELSTTTNA